MKNMIQSMVVVACMSSVLVQSTDLTDNYNNQDKINTFITQQECIIAQLRYFHWTDKITLSTDDIKALTKKAGPTDEQIKAYCQNLNSAYHIFARRLGIPTIAQSCDRYKQIDTYINQKNDSGDTALMNAAYRGFVDRVEALVAHPKIDVNQQNRDGNTALMKAASKDSINIDGVKALFGHSDIIDVNLKDNYGYTQLMRAGDVRYDAVGSVKALLAHSHIDVNLKDNYGYTALMRAASTDFIDSVKILIAHPDIDVNQQDKWGYTALMGAAWSCSVDSVEALVAHPKIDVNLKDIYGYTALDYANDPEIKALLIAHGAK